jgi:16S rRNA (guanine966-N2)-methyltransferase
MLLDITQIANRRVAEITPLGIPTPLTASLKSLMISQHIIAITTKSGTNRNRWKRVPRLTFLVKKCNILIVKSHAKAADEMRITGGEARGIQLQVPRSPYFRPTSDRVRAALFQVMSNLLMKARVLDLYAGSGSLGIEALSRGAEHADFVEQNPVLCRAIRNNLKKATLDSKGVVRKLSVGKAITTLKGPYDIILLDPPYNRSDLDETMEKLGDSNLLANEGLVVLEHSKQQIPQQSYGILGKDSERRYGDTVLTFYREGSS